MSPKNILSAFALLALASCGSGHSNSAGEAGNTTAAGAAIAATTTGTRQLGNTKNDTGLAAKLPSQKIIRIADFRCTVQNVLPAVTRLERTVQALGGIVQESRIENDASEMKTISYKPDSLKQVQTYTTSALLTLKVPSLQLDSVVNIIPAMASFIEARSIHQTNVSLLYLANELKNRETQSNEAVAPEMKFAKSTADALRAREYDHNMADVKVNRNIENLSMINDITYATITVHLQQPLQIRTQIIPNTAAIRTSFLTSVLESLAFGLNMIASIFVALLNIWPLWLMLIGLAFLYRKLKHRKLLMQHNQH